MNQARRQIGFRGTALMMFACVWIGVGVGVLRHPRPETASHILPLEYLGEDFRAAIWFAAAGVAIVTAWWPPGKDKWGWMALSIPAILRVVTYAVASVFGWLPVDFAITWVFITGLVFLLSAWPEMPLRRPPPTERGRG